MKKISIIVAAMTLALGLSQCKKEQPTTANGNDAVAITLDIKNNGGSRMDVNTSTGEVTYETGDVIYVASGGTFVGTLTHNGTNFGGTITNPTLGEPLHFYFLGNMTPAETLTAGTTTTCSVVISDQTEHLPVIEYAPSNETYNSGVTTFTAHLLNKCALVKFNVATSSEAATCITGMKNKVTVSFAENTLTHSQEGNGVITLPAGNGEKWAILLPQEALEEGLAYSEDGDYTGTRGAIPAIYDNGYLVTGIDVNVTTEVNPGEVPVGAICGKFTINSNGDQVYFSQGNLQYIGSAAEPYWKFAENQWDYFGDVSAGQNVDRDLFGWGTSGWNNGNMYYQPYNTVSFWDSEIGYGYGPTDGTNYNYDLTGDYANADWGVYNAISNGGNTPNQWRTLTYLEWEYIIFSRNTSSGIRYAKGIVNGVNGVILLPDNWSASVYALNYTNKYSAPFNTNEITSENWALMENNGAVFLPAAGSRQVGGNSESHGCYWSTSSFFSASFSYRVFFDDSALVMDCIDRFVGQSVRLVAPVEN